MRRSLLFLLLLSCLAGAETSYRFDTPPIMVNQKITLAQVGEKGRVHIQYDVRRIGAAGLKVYLYRHDDDPKGEPLKTWHFTHPEGRERISLNDLPVSVYFVWGQAVDEAGEPVATPTRMTTVEYGGWRAWEEFQQPESANDQAPAFTEMPVKTNIQGRDVQVIVSPAAVLLNPKEKVEFRVFFQGLPETDKVEWKLEGPGNLTKTEGNTIIYEAPDLVGSKMFRLRAISERHPEIEGGASILVTTQSKDEFMR
ncbi:MAG: hypothetical protein AB7S38_26035 [Vulcanimicrobiota bacterium]